MDAKILKAIEFLASKIEDTKNADEAMKYAQAALNLANAGAVIENSK